MTPEARVRAGNVVLVFDAPNVSVKKLFALALIVRDHGKSLRLVVPMTAHVEKIARLRREKGARYDAAKVRQALGDVGVDVLPLDAEAAEAIAERLCEWFPTSDAWQDAKWRRLHGNQPRSANEHPPATVDWYTAASCPADGIVVTSDTRGEFSHCETIKPDALEGVLREMATPPTSPG
jgi:hypothetical protein